MLCEENQVRDIYLDNSATTRVLPEVRDAMLRTLNEDFGNPSAMYRRGMEAEKLVRHAREQIAATLKVDEKEILFTSGGTESNNLALRGVMEANKRAGRHLITTKIEHPSIAEVANMLEEQGCEVTRLSVNSQGLIDLSELERAIRPDTVLVSVMLVNNEIGTIQPVEEIGALIKRVNPNTLFHVDAIQGYGKLVIRPRRAKIDLLSVSGHKIHGPKGIGFLYVREKVKIAPILFGGGQQNNLRSGTENVPGIVGLGEAAEQIYRDHEGKTAVLRRCREQLVRGLEALPEVVINGPEGDVCAPQIVSASFAGVRSEVLLHALEGEGICVSAGSACASNGQKHPSATLTAIGLSKAQMDSTLRFSLSVFTTEEEIAQTLAVLERQLPVLRRFTRR